MERIVSILFLNNITSTQGIQLFNRVRISIKITKTKNQIHIMKKQLQTFRNRMARALGIGLLSLGLSTSVTHAQTILINPSGDGGFENGLTFAANGWTVSNSANNPWFVGTPGGGAPMAGNKAYVSSDAGVTNSYIPTNNATNYFWREVTVPSTDSVIQLSFNWAQQGEASWDLWQVFTAPTTITPSGINTHPGSGLTNVPAGITGATFVANGSPQTGVQTTTIFLPKTLAGTTFRLIFSWKNETGGTQPPASIDNIALYSRPKMNFTSATTGNFNDTNTWTGSFILRTPTSLDTIEVMSGHTVTINAASQIAAKVIINGTLDYSATPTSFTIANDLVINSGGTLNAFNLTTGKGLVVGGNITNDGTIDLSKTSSLLTLNGTTAQTVGGSGILVSDTVRSLTFNNTATIPTINWNWTNVIVPGTLTFTRGWVNLGALNSMTLGASGTALGTLTYTVGGFTSGTFTRWIGTTGTGTTIAASTLPTFGTGSFPFILGNGNACHFHKATAALTAAGTFSVTFNGVTGTSAVGVPPSESSLTFDQKTNSSWTVATGNGYTSSVNHVFAIQGQGTYTAFSTNARLLNNEALVGTHQAGTIQPMSQRAAIPAGSIAGIYTIGLIGSEIPNQSIASGAWDNAAIWSAGVPTCGQNLVINTADSIWIDGSMVASNVGQIQLNGKLTVAGSTLNVGCANNNNQLLVSGRLVVSGGQLNLNGNANFASGSIFTQTGGNITIDGNSGSAGTSVLTGTPMVNIATNLVTLTGGNIVFVDGHVGTATADRVLTYTPTAAPYPLISTGHTVQFGDGVSTQANSTKGFETSLATRFYFGNIVVNTLASSNAFVASGSATVIVNGNLTITAGEFRGGTTNLIVGGNISNSGTLTNTGTLVFGQVIQTNMATPTITSQTVGQTVSGTGVFRNSTTTPTANYASVNINNTSLSGVTFSSAESLLSGANTGTVSSTLTFTNGMINTGANTFILGISTSTLGTLTLTNGGFASGSSFSRWWGSAIAGQTITAGAIPTAGVGTYPFVAIQSATPVSFFTRHAYIRQAVAATTGGRITLKHNPVAGTSVASIVDGLYTVESRTNSSWDVTTTGITGSPTYTIALSGSGLYEVVNGNSRITLASGPISGTHQGGTVFPHAQRSGVTLADLTGTWYMGASNADMAFYSVASGNWEDGTTWNKGIAPSCSDSVVIYDGHVVTVNATAASARSIGINLTGRLAVTGSSLTVGCTMQNASIRVSGNLTVSAGTVTINGGLFNNPSGRIHQSGGSIIVDGNDNGNVATSISNHVVDMFAVTDTSVLFTGGTITIVDPAVAAAGVSFKIFPNGPVNFSTAHTVIFGDGVSTQPGGSNAFNVNLFNAGTGLASFGNVVVNSPFGTNRFVNTSNTVGIIGNLTVTQGNYRMTSAHTVKGNIVNNDTLVNTNTLTLADPTNAITSTNTTAQSISGTGRFLNATTAATAGTASLTIRNSSIGGVTISTPLSVSGTLTLTRGIVNTTATDTFRLGSHNTSGTLAGGSDTAYINGPFSRTFAASRTATGTYTTAATLYPVGKSGRYLPVFIDPTTNAGGRTVVSAEAFSTNSGTLGAGVTSMSDIRWQSTYTDAANFVSANMRLTDTAAAFTTTTKLVSSATAGGAYTGAPVTITYAAGPPKTITTGTQILAADYLGNFAYGELVTCTTPANQATAFAANNLGATTFDGTFTAAVGGATHYLVVRYATGGTEVAPSNFTNYAVNAVLGTGTVVANTTGTTFAQTGLTAATGYDYYVYAYNNSGCFGPVYNTTAPLFATVTTCATVVPTPVGAAAVNITNNSFVARWNPIANPGATYVLDVSTNSGFSSFVSGYNALSTSTDTFAVVTGLTGNTGYFYRVRAIDGLCTSTLSTNQSVTTFCDPIVTLPWTENFDALGTVGLTSFPPCWTKTNGDWSTAIVSAYNTPRSGANYLRNAWTATNEYMWTPGFAVTAGTAYNLSFWVQGDGFTGWAVDVFYNSNPIVTGATQLGGTYTAPGTGTIALQSYNKVVYSFTAPSTGIYYLALRVNQPSGAPWYIAFDDFEFKPAVAPTVATGAKSAVSLSSAFLSANVVSDGGAAITTSGILIGTSPNPQVGDIGVIDSASFVPTQSGAYSFNVTGLTNSTTYYYRAYAINSVGTSYGVDSSFTTLAAPTPPSIVLSTITNVGPFSATLNANITGDGGSVVTASGIVYSTSPNPVIGGPGVVDSTSIATIGTYSITASGLNTLTKYYYRAYAINGIGTAYSTQDSLTTLFGINSVPYSQDFEGGAANWSTVTIGTANNWVLGTPSKTFLTGARSGVNAWNTGLTTQYDNNHDAAVVSPVFDFSGYAAQPYVRFYHKFITEAGWDALTVEISINGGAWTKLDNTLGTGGNYNTPNSTAWYNSASANGPIAPSKFSSLTAGVGSTGIYSTQNNGWIQSTTPLTGATGQSNVRFRFRFGSDGSGIQDGWSLDDIEVLFQTAPVVATSAASSVTTATATVGGNILSNGLSAVTASGVVIGTSANPSIGDPGVIDSLTTPNIGNGTYSFNLVGLALSTTYHFRAYATNALGTTYGPDSSFTTNAANVIPTVLTTATTNITVSSATVNANITSNGGDAVIASGIVYGTSPNPTIGDLGVVDSTTTPLVSIGTYSINPAGLTHTTKYYFRAYATNTVGTAYSAQDSFTTAILINTLPYTQNFDGGAAGWTAAANGGDNPWELGTPAKTFMNGAYSGSNAWVTKLVGPYSSVANSDAVVVSPQIDLTSATNPVLRFKHKFDTDADPDYDGGVVEISVNGGPWTRLNSATGTGANFNTATSYAWYNNASGLGTLGSNKFNGICSGYSSADGNGWIESATPLTGAAGQSNVKVRFRFWADAFGVDEGWEFDDIEIVDVVTPTTPASAVNLTAIANTTTTVNWTNGNGQGRLVVARLTTTPAVAPTNNTMYNENTTFGSGDITGTGNFIVYRSNTSSVVVNGLALLTDYTYDVYEYNGKYMHVAFAAAASNNGTTLPVTLTNFTATAKAKDALLNWTTASEINNRGFNIERSLDGRSFETVGFVKGAGNSNRNLNYAFTDLAAFNQSGVWYYRLKQVDFDGKFSYSQIVKVSVNAIQTSSATVYPNPFKSDYTLSFSSDKEGVAQIELMDMQGRMVSTTQLDVNAGLNAIPVTETAALQTGIYFLKVTINGESQTIKLVKE